MEYKGILRGRLIVSNTATTRITTATITQNNTEDLPVYANELGEFELKVNPKGKRSIHVSCKGFKDKNFTFYKNNDLQKFELEENPKTIEENDSNNNENDFIEVVEILKENPKKRMNTKKNTTENNILNSINWNFVLVVLVVVGIIGFIVFKFIKQSKLNKGVGIPTSNTNEIQEITNSIPKGITPTTTTPQPLENLSNTLKTPTIIKI